MEAMPVNSRRLISQAIVYIDNEPIAQVGIDNGTGPLVVDPDHGTAKAIGRYPDPGDVPIEMNILGRGEAHKPGEKESPGMEHGVLRAMSLVGRVRDWAESIEIYRSY